jgi:hypothetical protein
MIFSVSFAEAVGFILFVFVIAPALLWMGRFVSRTNSRLGILEDWKGTQGSLAGRLDLSERDNSRLSQEVAKLQTTVETLSGEVTELRILVATLTARLETFGKAPDRSEAR